MQLGAAPWDIWLWHASDLPPDPLLRLQHLLCSLASCRLPNFALRCLTILPRGSDACRGPEVSRQALTLSTAKAPDIGAKAPDIGAGNAHRALCPQAHADAPTSSVLPKHHASDVPGIRAGVAHSVPGAHAQESLGDSGSSQSTSIHGEGGVQGQHILPKGCLPDKCIHLRAQLRWA